MSDFHGRCGCKTEKKTLPMPLVGFSKKRIHVAMKLHTNRSGADELNPTRLAQTGTQQAPEW